MGESIVGVSRYEDKTGETAASKPGLEASISFGRFENDSLSWEKWSTFAPNKYLEEVEKCATPGSVAKKAAYFEAHYKKIAARKAEIMDQEKQMEDDSLRADNQNGVDLAETACGAGSEFDVSDRHCSAEDVAMQQTNLISEVSSTQVDDLKEDAAISTESQRSASEGVKEEIGCTVDSPKSKEPVLVKEVVIEEEESAVVESQDMKEVSHNCNNEMGHPTLVKVENVILDHHPKEFKKVTSVNQEKNATRLKKKPVSPGTKTLHISTPKVSKLILTPTALSASQSSTKKGNYSSLPRSKNPSAGESKKVAPKSLHSSLSLDPTDSNPASLRMTRKSFIMEEMGDKDIVKRAFKTFQKNINQPKSSGEDRASDPKQAPVKGTEPRVSSSMTPRKENQRSLKAGGVDKKSAEAAPSSFRLRSDEGAEKRKELSKKSEEKLNVKEAARTGLQSKQKLSKKSEEKLNVKEAARTSLQSKQKVEKGAEIRKLRQSFNFKATPLPAFYGGLKVSKSISDKEMLTNAVHGE
ncbi:hypothetical protein I3843_06G071600 [Carya illinoinensis]|uniref:TPX2 C-terminal domain-containing protein n=1 Tax=Carya illinoinensis TaxID=32201 RepID=A0A8T1Q976_CARIL|nr:protein WVD2-like 7 isoform X2 [Carya illinoinensis]KAG6650922.1 hypothetical protein CIPAW_06G076600 [Carya illinoinensis]KAG6708359.1 hypothetical protein I3842_06G077500 [Carya illinoinensis]KAG7974903.1 hypothetical protein I3843_06G071600 [Carya illinoinensis]